MKRLPFAFFLVLSGAAALHSNAEVIDNPACLRPSHNVSVNYLDESVSDFKSDLAELSYERVSKIGDVKSLRSNDAQQSEASDNNCNNNQAFWVLSAAGSLGENDFSSSNSFRLGTGLRYYLAKQRLTLAINGQVGNVNYKANDSSITITNLEILIGKSIPICLKRLDAGNCASPNKFVGNLWAKLGSSDQPQFSVRSVRLDQGESHIYSSFGASFDYGFGPPLTDNKFADGYRFKTDLTIDDKMESGAFDVNKIYSVGFSLRDTESFRTKWSLGSSFRWGSDEYNGWLISLSSDISTWN